MNASTLLFLSCIGLLVSCTDGANLAAVRMYSNFTISQYSPGTISAVRAITQSGDDPRITYYGSLGNNVAALVDQGRSVLPLQYTAITGFSSPGGVAWYQGSLFVAEENTIYRFDRIDSRFKNESLTRDKADAHSQFYTNWTAYNGHHGLKGTMAIKDGLIYLPIGSPCNHPLDGNRPDCFNYGRIITLSVTNLTVVNEVAKGLRNSVGMDFSPQTGELWFTDNGRDSWGLPGNDSAQFLRPSDELNRVSSLGQDFGFPYCYGSGLTWESGGNDDEYFTGNCRAANSSYTNAEWDTGAHTASLGMQFLPLTNNWPSVFQGSILIAQHGCWDCTNSDRGYRILAVHLDSTGTHAIGETTIADFKSSPPGATYGRPVDVQYMPDGSLLVSDDRENLVYRIQYNGSDSSVSGNAGILSSSSSSSSSPSSFSSSSSLTSNASTPSSLSSPPTSSSSSSFSSTGTSNTLIPSLPNMSSSSTGGPINFTGLINAAMTTPHSIVSMVWCFLVLMLCALIF